MSSENYIVINGKRAELTKEQLKALGIETRKPLFERVDDGGSYYFINNYGDINEDSREDDALFNNVNYFNDKDFAHQVSLHQLLYRRLLKFSFVNDAVDMPWDGFNYHFYIRYEYDAEINDWSVAVERLNRSINEVYFSSAIVAKKALTEIIQPFIKEHSEFAW